MHSKSINDIIKSFSSSEKTGLTQKQAEENQNRYGLNELPVQKPPGILHRFFSQFNDFMIYTLLCAALVSFAVSYLQGEPDYIEPAIILLIVIINAIIGTYQEMRAEHSIAALKKMTAQTAVVLRDGTYITMPASNLVPGDIIKLDTGCLIPADARLISSTGLMSDESSLTGESEPVHKFDSVLPADTPVSDRTNMVFSGCTVCYGHGTAIVCFTGSNTEIGNVAGLLIEEKAPDTPLQIRLQHTGKFLSITALFICVVIFIIGIFMNHPISDMFMTSVSLAVAAIPEGLPAIVTIMLSLGVTKMAENKAIIRHLPAVETLGSTTIICSDKTGTLTQNKMKVTKICDAHGEVFIHSEKYKKIISMCVLCNNSTYKNGQLTGEPTENALLMAGIDTGINPDSLNTTVKRIDEIPFDSKRKLMTTIHSYDNRTISITKGAPEMLLPLCKESDASKNKLLKTSVAYAAEGLRVLAVAFRDDLANKYEKNIESDLKFAGFICLIDPPRPEVKEAVKTCISAGIKPVMITGDHAATAFKIASELGIAAGKNEVITGRELETISDNKLDSAVENISVFARVTPEHKLRVVNSLKRLGHITAMTGDGVNDAPALKAANIGCAMGITGTDVSKNAADMILEDDNFATITVAVKEGRHIYDNIKKSIHFLISCNIGEIITIFFSILFGLAAPLTAVQLLWINLITDSFPALALGSEPADKNIMKRPPVNPSEGIFSGGLGFKIAIEGAFIGSLALTAYALGHHISHECAGTMCFAVLGLAQLFHSFNSRSNDSLFQIGLFSNKKLIASFMFCTLLSVITICIPALNIIFGTVPLATKEWLIVILLSILPIPIVEIQKVITKSS
ncbi:MAG: calcium-translocating P-type ATPase, PMCA-type [Lachnospiraceae bacterium]|nr:calcium-translocating P-type ATPase, PMCA-type [Lachnospiraceae bacterium]